MVYRARASYNDPDDSFKPAPRLNEQRLENNEKRARGNAKGYRQKPKRGSTCKGGRIIVCHNLVQYYNRRPKSGMCPFRSEAT